MALRLRSKLVNFCIGFVCAHSVFSMFGHLSTQHENQIANSFVSSQIEQVDCIYIYFLGRMDILMTLQYDCQNIKESVRISFKSMSVENKFPNL